MVKIKRVYEPPSKEDGIRILVDRLWPRGVSKDKVKLDKWMKEVAPSDELRRWFSHELEKWPEFKKRYRAELSSKQDLLRQILRLEEEKTNVTLVYSAKDTEHNNAVVLKEALEKK